MALQIKPATKFRQYARVCFWGCPKQGKSHSALAIARAIVGPHGKVGVISSEYGSSNLLSRKFPHDIIDLTVDEYGNEVKNAFDPARYEEALRLFVAQGYEAIVIDSLSHAWEGEGGVLEKVNEKKNTFTDGWGQVGTPMYQHLIKTILSTRAHIFITIRAKDGYVIEQNKEGKNVPRNVGLKPVIRSSFGYEMQLTIRMDALVGHIEESAFQDEFPQGTQIVRPGEDVAATLLQCLDGVPEPEPTSQQSEMRHLLDALYQLAPAVYAKYAQWEEMALRAALGLQEGPLPEDYTDEHLELMRAYVEAKKKPVTRKAQRPATTEADPAQASGDAPVDREPAAPTESEQSAPTSPASSHAPEQSHLSLDEQIKQAKSRTQKLGLAKDGQEWAALLSTLKLKSLESVADLEKVNAHLEQFERNQGAQAETPTRASEQQVASIKKLCGLLSREVPETSTMTDAVARQTIKELSAAYKEARSALPVR